MARWTFAVVGLAALIGAAQLDLRAEPRPAAQHEAEPKPAPPRRGPCSTGTALPATTGAR